MTTALRAECFVPSNHLMAGLLGTRDEYLRQIERAFPDEQIVVQGNRISVEGPAAELVVRLFDELVLMLQAGKHIDSSTLARTIDMVREDIRPSEVLRSEVVRGAGGKTVRANTAGQKRYVDAISQNVITFGIGPAGTGKSYLAVAQAVHSLQSRQVNRIILTRPAVEAGERLGFLPGDLMAKVDPYLRPLYDALYDLLEPEGAQRMLGPRHHRGGAARVHARPHAQQLLHHPRRGAEHHARADEDVPHPHRLRVQVRRHRRRDPDRRAGWALRLGRARAGARWHRRHRVRPSHPTRRRPAQNRGRHRRRLRGGRRAGGTALVTIDVFAADEQQAHPVDVARWAALARQVLAARGVKGETEVSLLFVDEDAIAALNEQFLGKAGPTDVLSFPIEDEPVSSGRSPDFGGSGPGADPEEVALTLLGDVVVCPAVAARNADEHEVSVDDEVALLVVHGLLHLLGMDHEDEAEAERMEALERQLLDRFYRAAG